MVIAVRANLRRGRRQPKLRNQPLRSLFWRNGRGWPVTAIIVGRNEGQASLTRQSATSSIWGVGIHRAFGFLSGIVSEAYSELLAHEFDTVTNLPPPDTFGICGLRVLVITGGVSFMRAIALFRTRRGCPVRNAHDFVRAWHYGLDVSFRATVAVYIRGTRYSGHDSVSKDCDYK